MARTLSEDLRGRVIAVVEGGASRRAAAERFGIGVATAIRWVRVFRATGMVSAQPKGGDLRSHRIEAFRDAVSCAIEAHKDIMLAELDALLRREHGVKFAISTVRRHLVRHRITLKKAAHAAEQDRPDVARRRQAWFDAQPDLDPARLLPPYSPDFDPIENAFSKFKALLRRAAARTIPDLWTAIADALPHFTLGECANYFTACGYEPE